MPAQHIKEKTWERVEKETVKAVIQTRANLRTTEILDLLINKGLQAIYPEDYEALAKSKGK